ncbi:pyridoxamine 5'-phosphate oxidase family protein [Caulobacter sp. 1776]|uniref:pyridoxamine 5'-phosphate oxidase family protein n=1 Tax=Caulobacter sp. 1776 TaxID=3156420 RepID=UPI0033937078
MSSHDLKAVPAPLDPEQAKARALDILAHGRLMTLATVRPDGWPQATVVNYLAEGLSLFFVVARNSQKLVNIARDPRVAIALGTDAQGAAVGLSMAARVSEVNDPVRIQALNRRIWGDPDDQRFTPHPSGVAVALLEARPVLVSLIDYESVGAAAQHFSVEADWRLTTVTQPHGADGVPPSPA